MSAESNYQWYLIMSLIKSPNLKEIKYDFLDSHMCLHIILKAVISTDNLTNKFKK